MGEGAIRLVSFKSVGMNHTAYSFTFYNWSWLFLKGLPAIALAQARRAGDISKKIPPGLAVVK